MGIISKFIMLMEKNKKAQIKFNADQIEEVELFHNLGIQSIPLNNKDYLLTTEGQSYGNQVGHAWKDTVEIKNLEQGETIIYARDKNGDIISNITLKNNKIEINIGASNLILDKSGEISINCTNLKVNGNIEANNVKAKSEITAGIVKLSTHVHPYTDNGASLMTGKGV